MAPQKVFFGPFVGELGWEQSFFSGYVRRFLEATARRDFEVHVMSYPGRQVFYGPDVVFHSLPPELSCARISQNAYVTDQWIGTWPSIPGGGAFLSDVQSIYERAVADVRERIGFVSRLISPVRPFQCVFNPSQVWGTFISPLRPLSPRPLNLPIALQAQVYRRIEPFPEDIERLARLAPNLVDAGDRPVVAVLPRRRAGRRPEKNWPEAHYRELVARLQEAGALVVLIGAPGGCYFTDTPVPVDAVDLINGISEDARLGLHVAALRRSRFAVGGISGALLMVMGCGVPVIEWGRALHEAETRRQNMLNTPIAYLQGQVPTLESVWTIVAETLKMGAVKGGSYAVELDVDATEQSRRVAVPTTEILRMKVFQRIDRALFELNGQPAEETSLALQPGR